jgi:hypothetical protein
MCVPVYSLLIEEGDFKIIRLQLFSEIICLVPALQFGIHTFELVVSCVTVADDGISHRILVDYWYEHIII